MSGWSAQEIILGLCCVGGGIYFMWMWLTRSPSEPGPGKFTYVGRKLLTPNEVEFYQRLCSAVGEKYCVLAQVSMGALMEPDKDTLPKEMMKARAYFHQKVVDYVICDKATMEAKLLIELDDSKHDKKKDAKRDALTESAGYKTIRYESKAKPSVEALRKDITRACRKFWLF